jgi:SAM-dependent MidA family methyltransferase
MNPTPPAARPAGLPAPSAEAHAHSDRVAAHIARSIEAAGGWISFADYMQQALYAPGLGYYAAGARKFGAAGDFVTAPEMTELFGVAVAVQLAEVLAAVPEGDVIELGPGSGKLAADILAELAARDALPIRYRLLETSPDLRERQREHLLARVPECMSRIDWIDAVPRPWRGAIVANEVLDAVPPHLIGRRDGTWFERGVVLDGGERFALSDQPLVDGALRNAAMARFPASGDYLSELNPAAEALVTLLARHCERGALLLLDYGFPASEYYHPQRASGTLMAHYRQYALADLFFLPGLCDLTAHVDFTAMAHAASKGGMSVAGYTTQAHFLVNCGILDALARRGDPSTAAYLREAAAVQKLLSPAEMGELFKVFALVRGIGDDLAGFRDGDQGHRL